MRFVLLLAAMSACAQPPAILQEGVVNAASHMPPSLPGGALAPGGRFVVQGLRFVPETRIEFANGDQATVVSRQDEQLEAVLAGDAKPGETTLRVRTVQGASASVPIRVAVSAPGLYTVNGRGWGPASLVDETGSIEHPAQSGDVVGVRATGTGRDSTLDLWLGGVRVPLEGLQHAGGVDIALFRIPPAAPRACFVPVIVRSPSSGLVSNAATIAIAEKGGPCAESPFWPIHYRAPDLRSGLLMLLRERIFFRHAGKSFSYFKDEVLGTFFERKPSRPVTALHIFPPEGTCTNTIGVFAPEDLTPSFNRILFTEVVAHALDAGRLSVSNGKDSRNILPAEGFPGEYKTVLADPKHFRPFLVTGETMRISGAGGTDAKGFDYTVRMQVPVRWRNRERAAVVDRTKPLRFEWEAPSRNVRTAAVVVNIDQETTAMNACVCLSKGGQSAIEIPPQFLSNLPPSKQITGIPTGFVFLITIPSDPSPSPAVKGLDSMHLFQAHLEGQTAKIY